MAQTLKDLIKIVGGGFDVGDNTFDWGTNYDYGTDLKDYYDKALDLMASEIEVVLYNPKWYSTCKICEFIEKYQDVFDKFLNEENKEEYTPKYACKELGVDRLDPNMEDFYDIYLNSFESLLAGGYCESDYKKLYEMLSKAIEDKKNQEKVVTISFQNGKTFEGLKLSIAQGLYMVQSKKDVSDNFIRNNHKQTCWICKVSDLPKALLDELMKDASFRAETGLAK